MTPTERKLLARAEAAEAQLDKLLLRAKSAEALLEEMEDKVAELEEALGRKTASASAEPKVRSIKEQIEKDRHYYDAFLEEMLEVAKRQSAPRSDIPHIPLSPHLQATFNVQRNFVDDSVILILRVDGSRWFQHIEAHELALHGRECLKENVKKMLSRAAKDMGVQVCVDDVDIVTDIYMKRIRGAKI